MNFWNAKTEDDCLLQSIGRTRTHSAFSSNNKRYEAPGATYSDLQLLACQSQDRMRRGGIGYHSSRYPHKQLFGCLFLLDRPTGRNEKILINAYTHFGDDLGPGAHDQRGIASFSNTVTRYDSPVWHGPAKKDPSLGGGVRGVGGSTFSGQG